MSIIDDAINHYEYGISHDIFAEPVLSYAQAAVSALRAQQAKVVEIDQVKPLTLDELREMDGEPVWLSDGRCFIVNQDLGYEMHGLATSLFILADIGLYRHKPEERIP